jgi:hypothetical protein
VTIEQWVPDKVLVQSYIAIDTAAKMNQVKNANKPVFGSNFFKSKN